MLSRNNGTKRLYGLIYFFTIIIVFSVTFSILKLLEEHNDNHENFLFETAKVHFDDIINSRAWNAQYGGVYVYAKEGIKPNPYLKNNHTYDKDGEILVKINPAWMTRMLSEVGKSDDYHFRITSLKPINPTNEPDEFESKALRYLEEHPAEHYYTQAKKDSTEYRFLGKLAVTDACMRCHAEQGYQVGNIRGGISVTMNAKNIYASLDFMENVRIFVVFVALMILLVSGYMLMFIYRHQMFVKNQNIYLEDAVKKRTKELELAKKEAETANRLKTEFLSNVTHEIKTPLNTILSMSRLAMDEFETPNRDYLTSINSAGKNLNMLVENIIDYSKLEAGILGLNIGIFNIKTLITDVRDFNAVKAVTKGIELRFNIDSTIPASLSGDVGKVYQILNHLSDNAIKFTPSGGNVTLSVDLISKEKENVVLSFSVIDSGVGIANEDQKKLFQDILQLDQSLQRSYGGIGIGLIFCKKLTKILGGKISLNSEVDKGTTVRVELPFIVSYEKKLYSDESVKNAPIIEESKRVSDIRPPVECIELLNRLKMELDNDYSKAIETLAQLKTMVNNTNIEAEVILIVQKINMFEVEDAKVMIDTLLVEVSKENR